MKCFAIFVLIALAAVAMAQEYDGQSPVITVDYQERDPSLAPETEPKREKRGYYSTQYSAPYAYGAGYTGYHAHYSAPNIYYRSYPNYGYGYRSNYYY